MTLLVRLHHQIHLHQDPKNRVVTPSSTIPSQLLSISSQTSIAEGNVLELLSSQSPRTAEYPSGGSHPSTNCVGYPKPSPSLSIKTKEVTLSSTTPLSIIKTHHKSLLHLDTHWHCHHYSLQIPNYTHPPQNNFL